MTRVSTPRPTPGAVGGWTVVLPVKGGPAAKSRLDHPARDVLARAMALDAVEAVLACDRVGLVLVVTADPGTAAAHSALGAQVVADPGGGLDDAVAAGLAAAVGQAPHRPCALLLADLPALQPADMAVALDACGRLLGRDAPSADHQVTVPDADGTGTVLLAAAGPARLRPRFGTGSAAAHAADALVLTGAPDRLRRDVDTSAHLVEAVRLGVGPRTARALADVRPQARSTIAPSAASFSPKRS